MSCGCKTECAPFVVTTQGPQGEPGPPVVITSLTVLPLPPGTDPSTQVLGTDGVYSLVIGFPLAVPGVQGAQGDAGTPATNLFTTLTAFTVPGLDSSTVAIVGNTSWMTIGGWLYIRGAGYFRISNILSPTTVQLSNPGNLSVWGASGIPLQAAPGTVVTPDATANQVIQAGIPGIPGATGQTGGTGPSAPPNEIVIVTTPPVGAPAAGRELQVYTDSLSAPSTVQLYAWDGTAWDASPNLIGPAGTVITTTNTDPTSSPPSGPVGTIIIRTDVAGIYVKTSGSTASLLVSLTPTFNQVWAQSSGAMQNAIYYTPLLYTHTSDASPYVLDLTRKLTVINLQDNIELDYGSLTVYAEWILEIENTTVGSLNVDFTSGKWEEAASLAISAPIAVGAGDRLILKYTSSKGSLLITDVIVPASL